MPERTKLDPRTAENECGKGQQPKVEQHAQTKKKKLKADLLLNLWTKTHGAKRTELSLLGSSLRRAPGHALPAIERTRIPGLTKKQQKS
jgi:hypothetical protein